MLSVKSLARRFNVGFSLDPGVGPHLMHGGSQIRHSESPRLNKKMIRASLATQVEAKIGLPRIFVLLPRHGVIYSLYYIPGILLDIRSGTNHGEPVRENIPL